MGVSIQIVGSSFDIEGSSDEAGGRASEDLECGFRRRASFIGRRRKSLRGCPTLLPGSAKLGRGSRQSGRRPQRTSPDVEGRTDRGRGRLRLGSGKFVRRRGSLIPGRGKLGRGPRMEKVSVARLFETVEVPRSSVHCVRLSDSGGQLGRIPPLDHSRPRRRSVEPVDSGLQERGANEDRPSQ